MKTENTIAKVIFNIGVAIIFLGVIGSFVMGGIVTPDGSKYSSDYNWSILLNGGFTSLVSGFLLIGFAEIINLLQSICDKTGGIKALIATESIPNQESGYLTLTKGKYSVGADIQPGDYILTGNGRMKILNSSGAYALDADLNESGMQSSIFTGYTIWIEGVCMFDKQ